MEKLLIVNDIHIGSKYSDDPDAAAKLNALLPDSQTYLNGDIVDMSCCPKKDVTRLREYQKNLVAKWGQNYIRGNHDLRPYSTETKIHKLDSGHKVLITHGHLVGSDKRVSKWMKYEKKAAGAGRLKLLWVDFADDMDWLKGNRPLPKDVIADAVSTAKHSGCKYVILGHFHPPKRMNVTQDGVTVIFLPKGFNEVVF